VHGGRSPACDVHGGRSPACDVNGGRVLEGV